MQLPNSPKADKIPLIEAALHVDRLNRYMAAAENDKDQAFRYYLWNCTLCESFYLSLHFCEVICRNTLSKGVKAKLGNDWHTNDTLIKILDERYSRELSQAVKSESNQHGANLTCNHIVSALSFGFWQHLATKRFERLLWNEGIRKYFPNAPAHKNREDLFRLIGTVRIWRNRIAHHEAIFDKGPTRKHHAALELIKWVCLDTYEYVSSISKVPVAISLRPKDRTLL